MEEHLGKTRATLLRMLVQAIQVHGAVEVLPRMALRPMVTQDQLDGEDDWLGDEARSNDTLYYTKNAPMYTLLFACGIATLDSSSHGVGV